MSDRAFSNSSIDWQPLPHMQEYLNELEAQLKSPDYIRKVKLGLAHFALFCRESEVLSPQDITRNHILRFQSWVNRQEGWKRSYQQQIMKYVRGWINWLDVVRYVSENPWYHIKVGHTEKKPNPLTDEEVGLLFEAHRRQAYANSPFVFHRREVILTLLYGWGLRLHELLALNVANMDMRLDHVTAINKGGTTKALPYGQTMKLVVRRWLPVRARHAVVGEDALLIDQQGKRMSSDMAYKTVADLGSKAGFNVHPHQLRDTCGTHLLDSDMEVERVMKILGHTNVKQTLSYSQVNDRKVAEAHERAMTPRLNSLLFHHTGQLQPEGNPNEGVTHGQ